MRGYETTTMLSRQYGPHRSTIVAACLAGMVKFRRPNNASYEIEVESFLVWYRDIYRFGDSAPVTGRTWSREELLILALDISDRDAAARLGRSYASVRSKRCKMRKERLR